MDGAPGQRRAPLRENRGADPRPDGEDLPPGEIGDIYLRSAAYGGSSYLGAAPQMASTDDGFASVGDIGYLDEDGYLYLVDRRVDMIITGGANVFPAEVEVGVDDHPEVATWSSSA